MLTNNGNLPDCPKVPVMKNTISQWATSVLLQDKQNQQVQWTFYEMEPSD